MGNAFRTLEGSQSKTEDDSQFIESYDGETTQEGVYHGKGILCYSSDDSRQRERYEGEWYQGKRNGKGTLSWRNGAVYQGTWKDDMLHGMGIFLLPSGLCYEGEFYENKFQGLGVLIWKNGKKFEGSWVANRHHGYGCLTYPVNDQRKRKYYKGEWKAGKMHGQGVMVWTNGAKYTGSWINGKREGYGKHIFPSNQVFVGNWENGKREGPGTRHFGNGDRFEGIWKDDTKEGMGYYIFAHGRKVPHFHEKGILKEDSEEVVPQLVQTLQVLCIETIAKHDDLVTKVGSQLPSDLAERVRKLSRNGMEANPQDSSFIHKVQEMLSRFSKPQDTAVQHSS